MEPFLPSVFQSLQRVFKKGCIEGRAHDDDGGDDDY